VAEADDKGGAPGRVMPLTMAHIGQEVALAAMHGGRGFLHRMAEMGLTPGVRFRVMSRGAPGPFIVSLKGMRLVLGRGLAHRMLVKVVEGPPPP